MRRSVDARLVAIAREAKEPVGFLRLELLWGLVPNIGLVHVVPGERSRGAGRALLAFVTAAMKKEKHRYLFSAAPSNDPDAQGWHRKVGFEDCGMLLGANDGDVGEIFFRLPLR